MRKLTIEMMHEIAKQREGKCLSDKYINGNIKLRWQCNNGHIWKTTPITIKSGHWCPRCIGRGKTIEDMQKLAEAKKGKCISKRYVKAKNKLKWQCDKGHTWYAVPLSIKKGHWCPHCARKAKLSIEEMRHIAKNMGGKCLSKTYVNNLTKLKWKCSNGHTWEARPADVKRGQWCPYCSKGIGERICREYFERLLGYRFIKTRPNWLINDTGNKLELDGYNKKLGLAFEYQGIQHYQYLHHFHKNRANYAIRKRCDDIKKELCKKNNVELIHIKFNNDYNKLGKEIENKLKNNFVLVTSADKLDYHEFKVFSKKNLLELQEFAKSKGGKCLSKKYVDCYTKLKWRCDKGHVWEALPYSIKVMKTWCPQCAGTVKGDVKEMQQLAKSKSGKCLSKDYTDNKTKLEWRCSKGHIWKTTPSQIKSGAWCPYCAKNQPLSLKDAQISAKSRSGECLSDRYINNRSKLKWKCRKGHIWKNSLSHIKSGQWCPICAIERRSTKRRLSIEEVKYLAKRSKGKLLSKEYINAHTNLKWQCEKGHIWEATLLSVKYKGRWCPFCARK